MKRGAIVEKKGSRGETFEMDLNVFACKKIFCLYMIVRTMENFQG
jgi:hypothetical protein